MYLDGAIGAARDYTFARNVVFQSTQWPIFLFACGKEGNHFIDNVFLKEGNLPTVLVEALRARCGLEPAYRRALLKTNDPRCNEYALSSDNGSPGAWTAYQLDLPQAGKGVVEVFRRCDAKTASLRVKPRGLDPRAVYDLEAWVGTFDRQDDLLLTGVARAGRSADGQEVLATGQTRMTGRQLAEEGLLVRLPRVWPRWRKWIVPAARSRWPWFCGANTPPALLERSESTPGIWGTAQRLRDPRCSTYTACLEVTRQH
jgi:hypothetical protein